jgi:hypothetical protein
LWKGPSVSLSRSIHLLNTFFPLYHETGQPLRNNHSQSGHCVPLETEAHSDASSFLLRL